MTAKVKVEVMFSSIILFDSYFHVLEYIYALLTEHFKNVNIGEESIFWKFKYFSSVH